jgi:hypothetical protein
MQKTIFLVFTIFILPKFSIAQGEVINSDSLKTYHLSEVVGNSKLGNSFNGKRFIEF